jgi:hypothetical protein
MIVMGRLGWGCSGSSVVAEERLTSPPKTMAGYNYNKIGFGGLARKERTHEAVKVL